MAHASPPPAGDTALRSEDYSRTKGLFLLLSVRRLSPCEIYPNAPNQPAQRTRQYLGDERLFHLRFLPISVPALILPPIASPITFAPPQLYVTHYMTPMPVSRTSSESIPDPTDRPERSRNAKAQARHRAKRKAYIEQLETTVTKLQVALALSPEQVAALPAPVIRIRELEEENEILHRELDELRRQLEDRNARLRPDLARRHMPSSPYDRGEYDSRRRRLTDSTVYLQAQNGHTHSPPPPLLIPSSTSQQSQQASQVGMYPRLTSSTTLTSYGMYQLPGTPSSSGASTASNSPFSPCDYTPPSTTMHSHRPTSATAHSPSLLAYGQAPGQYEYVKVEEDSYEGHAASHNSYSASLPPFASAGSQSSLNHWQTYSAQRS